MTLYYSPSSVCCCDSSVRRLVLLLALVVVTSLLVTVPSLASVDSPHDTSTFAHLSNVVTSHPSPRPLGLPAQPLIQGANADDTSTQPAGLGIARTVTSLLLVLAIVIVLSWIARRFVSNSRGQAVISTSRSPAGILEVLGRYTLVPGTTLILLKLDTRILLLSQTGSGFSFSKSRAASSLTLISEVTRPEEVASILTKARDADGTSFASQFRSMIDSCRSSDPAAATEPDTQTTIAPADPQPPTPSVHVRRHGHSPVQTSTTSELGTSKEILA